MASDQRSRVASLVVAFDQPVQLDTSAMTLTLHTNNVTLGGVAQPNGFGSLPTSLALSTTDNMTLIVTFTGNTDAGADGYQPFHDFNGDGIINSGDNLQFRNRFNKALKWRV